MADALRFNTGKAALRYVLTFPKALAAFAQVCMYGASKYRQFNYLRGAPLSQYVDCLMRHLVAWHAGEDTDPESQQPHLAHVVWNALALCEMALSQPHRDDRPVTVMASQDEADAPITAALGGHDAPMQSQPPARPGYCIRSFDHKCEPARCDCPDGGEPL